MSENKDYDELKEMMATPKKKIEDSHIRTTILLDADLSERLDKLSEGQKRGFKTKFFNAAVRQLLDELES